MATFQVNRENILYFLLAEYLVKKMQGLEVVDLKESLLEAELLAANIYDTGIEYYLDIFKYSFFDSKIALWREYYDRYCLEHDSLRISKIGYLFSDWGIKMQPEP